MLRRHTLLVRFFAISVVIAACSIAATAWLATSAATRTIRQEQGDALATDTRLYDDLLAYAATHRSWDGVRPKLAELARASGRRIALTTLDRAVIADTGGPDAPKLPVRSTAVVNPLEVDLALKPGASTDRIDPRAVGPFALTADERAQTRGSAESLLACVGRTTSGARVATAPNGRSTVVKPDGTPFDVGDLFDTPCGGELKRAVFPAILPTERLANGQLVTLLSACLKRVNPAFVPDPRWANPSVPAWFGRPPTPLTDSARRLSGGQLIAPADVATGCLTTARREQLTPHVAPAAQLFLTAATGAEPRRPDLSTAGTTRIALTALAILAVAMFAAWLSAVQLVRPVRAVTSAARRMGLGERDVRVERHGGGELGELADSFNAMSERLDGVEKQRKAMVSDIAHELRTPLGNITGWLEATQDGLATADAELVRMLLTESLLLEVLVSDLQDLAQADAGTLRLHHEQLDAADIVDQVTAAHQAAADDSGVRLRAATRGSLDLHADPVRLRQALGNLVTNAVRYTPSGGEVTVTGRRHGEHIVLEVADTGTGIDPADLPLVFDRFWRADRSRSRRTGGSGLGLAITRHLVEAHGGTVTAESLPGSGSTFRVRLPSAPPDEG